MTSAEEQVLQQLSHEVLEMADMLLELAERRRPVTQAALARLRGVVRRQWPAARVELYGSAATGLALPASDLDVVITNVPDNLQWWGLLAPLDTLAEQLKHESWVSSVKPVRNAHMPVIKLDASAAALAPAVLAATATAPAAAASVDVSFDFPSGTHQGLQTSNVVLRLKSGNPVLRPLVLVLKQLLLERGLNDAYMGGLSSYALTVMAAAVLQRHALEPPEERPSLGALFAAVLATYGTR
ncbi:unnamed protein product [Phaeothamnion confervicola]